MVIPVFLLVLLTLTAHCSSEPLTSDERQWLRENQSRIIHAVETGYPPFVFLNAQNKPSGLAHDYLLLLESKLGVKFRQKQFATLEEIFAKARNGEVQVINAVTKTEERSEFLAFTNSFISIPNVIIVRNDRSGTIREEELAGLKVSLVKSYAITEHMQKNRPGITVDLVPDDLAAILNVSFGRSDAAVIDLATASYFIAQKGLTNLRVAGEASVGIDLAIGVPRSEPVLYGIIQKGLDSITVEERQRIYDHWIHLSSQNIVSESHLLIAVAIVSLAGICITIGVILWNRMLTRQVFHRTEELSRERDALRLSEEHHRTILQTAMDGIWRVDVQGRLLEVNDAYCAMSGFSKEELLSMKIADLDVNETEEDTIRHIQDVVNVGLSRFETRHRRKDGTVFDVEVSTQYSSDDIGQCVSFLRDITERKRADEAIWKEKAFLRALIDSAVDLIYFKDSNSIYLGCNKASEKFTGINEADQIGRTDFDFFDRELAEKIVENDLKVLTDGLVIRLEEWVNAADGSKVLLDTVKTPIYGKDGQPIGLVGISRDITEKKELENALLQSEQSFKAIFDASPIPFAINNQQGRVIALNRSFVQTLGYTIDDIPTVVQWWPLAYPEWHYRQQVADTWNQAIEECRRSGQPFTPQEATVHCKDGSLRSFLISMATLGEHLTGDHLVVMYDITEIRRAEAELRSSAERFRAVFERSSIGKSLTSVDGTMLQINKSFADMLGYTVEEMQGHQFSDISHPDDLAKSFECIRNLVSGEQNSCRFEKRYLHKNGSIVWTDVSTTLLRDDQGDPCYLVTSIIDITARKMAEEERSSLADQLHQSQKIESVGRLAGGVAHDFNNMLSVILGHCEMLLMRITPDQPAYSPLMEISKAASRSSDLTRQLLAFARKQTVSPKLLDLNDSVSGMLRMLQRLIGENINLTWKPEQGLWPVMIDPSQVDQILANLCVNARDAITGVGNVVIETGCCTVDDIYCKKHLYASPGDYVKIVVSDDGAGMDKETEGHIFEPFFTTKTLGEGTGLGLATVYGIVRQNKGFINVYSEPGSGSTFIAYLPRYLGNMGVTPGDNARATLKCGSEHILLVEDEPAILEVISLFLREIGYTVLQAKSPGEAISLARDHSGEIDLLMTDVVMPEMNGWDLAKNILSLYPEIKCLFMSGYTADVVSLKGILAEGVAFIQKPFQMKAMAAKIREVLDGVEAPSKTS